MRENGVGSRVIAGGGTTTATFRSEPNEASLISTQFASLSRPEDHHASGATFTKDFLLLLLNRR
mgnify:CR=1 FL=1